MTVAVFNISKVKDKLGNDIEPVVDYPAGLIWYFFIITYSASRMLIVFSHPKRYQSKITPRSEKAISLIQTIQDEHPLTKGDSETIMSIPTGA